MGNKLTSLCFLQPMYENKSLVYEINLDKLKIFLLLVSLLTSPQPVPGAGHAYYVFTLNSVSIEECQSSCSRLFQNITLNMVVL